jgi:hypothetical protein
MLRHSPDAPPSAGYFAMHMIATWQKTIARLSRRTKDFRNNLMLRKNHVLLTSSDFGNFRTNQSASTGIHYISR